MVHYTQVEPQFGATGSDYRQQVTLGIPVYNEQSYLRETVSSALDQSFHITISDNASTDGTAAIAREFAARYEHVSYVRHAENIGAINNFKSLLDAADTPYFMWLGSHDRLCRDYTRLLVQAHEENPGSALAFSPVIHIGAAGEEIYRFEYEHVDVLASPDPFHRVYHLMSSVDDCTLVHGLFRTEALRQAWFHVPCIGLDHVMMARAAAVGTLHYVPQVHYYRRSYRKEDSLEKQLERIDPQERRRRNFFAEMIRGQLEVVQSLPADNPAQQLWRVSLARYHLMRRFGLVRSAKREIRRLLRMP